MVRVVALGILVAGVFSPQPARAAPPEKDPIRFRPSFAAGVAFGKATEVVECSARGSFECQLPAKSEHSFGFQAAPTFEAVGMVGRNMGFRFGLGVRYLPGMLLDTGSELHVAVVPEVAGELPGKRHGYARLFNSLGVGFPKPAIRRRQEPTRSACARLDGIPDAHCNDRTTNPFLSFALEVGLVERFEGYAVRYGLGFQGLLSLNHAVVNGYTGSDPDNTDDSLYVTYDNEGARFVAHVGVEF